MNKSDLIDALARDQNLPIKTAESILATVLDAMTETLVEGGNVEIRGFGSFTVREYQSYDGRNPKTHKIVKVKPKKLPFFKVGKELRKAVNDGKAK
ncbi:MAG: integration host factor subunit beta [Desulforhopalus sp.]|jgi:integration host factor subunit beta|nr:integration host factor subunit beta [Desulforhopalus sp.]